MLRPNSPRADKIAARRAARKSAGTAPGAMLHGPGGLLGAPGLGRRKAFDESKVDRDEGGQFSGGGGGGGGEKPKAEKPKRDKKPKPSKAERAEQAKAEAAANREAVGNELMAADGPINRRELDGLDAIRTGGPTPEQAELAIQQGYAVRGRDGRVQLSPEGKKILGAADKGDTQEVLNAVSAANDKKLARQERDAAREQKRAAREAKRAERERARAERQAGKKPKPEPSRPASGGGSGGSGPKSRPVLVGGRTLDLTEALSTDKAMRPGRRKLWRGAYAQAKASGLDQKTARALASRALRHQDVQRAATGYRKAVGRLAVFKDAQGRDRWAAISSTAYRDRDGEIVSTEALRGAVALADAGGQGRGPLRFWHQPGLDVGDCDFQATAADGRVLIESGTFRRPAYAQAVKAAADGYQMSIGFTHPATEPDAAGVFRTIQIFERSLVPAGRASNPFTRITTKETAMLPAEKLNALKALLGDEGAAQLLAGAQQTDKAAQAAGVAYKSDQSEPVYPLADGSPGVIRDGRLVALKSLALKAPPSPEQMLQAAMTEAGDAAEAMPPAAAAEAGAELEAEGEVITDDTDVMDLTVGDLRAVLGGAVEELITGYNTKMAEMKQQYDAMGKAFGQMQAQKDTDRAETAETVKALRAQVDALTAELATLKADAPPPPPIPVTAETAQAIAQKSRQDGAPRDPIDAIVAAAFPQLYQNGAAQGATGD